MRQALPGNAGAGVAHREHDVAVLAGDLQRETPPTVHRLDPVEGDVPEHLRELIPVEGEARHRGIDRHLDVHAGGPRAAVADQPADVLDHLPDVARHPPGFLGPREVQEVGEDAVEPPRFGADRRQRGRALVGGEARLVVEQRRRVDDGRQRIADLVGHAGGQLARRGQALDLTQAGVKPVALTARALEHHDDHREGRQEVERDEHRVDHHVAGGARLHVHELGGNAMDPPHGQEAAQEPLAPEPGAATARRPEQHAGRHLDDAQGQAHDALSLVVTAEVTRQRQERHRARPHQEVSPVQAIVPSVRERGGQREADRGDGGDVGDEARVMDVQEEHVHEPQALGQRVRAPRQQQVLEEAHAVRGVQVDEDEQLDGEHDGRHECQHQRHGHQRVTLFSKGNARSIPPSPISESTPWGKWCATRARCEIAALAVARGFHFRTAFQCGTGALAQRVPG